MAMKGRYRYISGMSTKIDDKHSRRRTTSVPVTTMEEIPVLSDSLRADLLRSLKDAEARAAVGEAADYGAKTFKARLLKIYRGGKH
jgi:hypothetical protein